MFAVVVSGDVFLLLSCFFVCFVMLLCVFYHPCVLSSTQSVSQHLHFFYNWLNGLMTSIFVKVIIEAASVMIYVVWLARSFIFPSYLCCCRSLSHSVSASVSKHPFLTDWINVVRVVVVVIWNCYDWCCFVFMVFSCLLLFSIIICVAVVHWVSHSSAPPSTSTIFFGCLNEWLMMLFRLLLTHYITHACCCFLVMLGLYLLFSIIVVLSFNQSASIHVWLTDCLTDCWNLISNTTIMKNNI